MTMSELMQLQCDNVMGFRTPRQSFADPHHFYIRLYKIYLSINKKKQERVHTHRMNA